MPDDKSFNLCDKSTWVFDLDNTLYPAECDLFAQIDQRIGEFVQKLTGLTGDDARTYQKKLFLAHGTTLNGLMLAHDIDPVEYMNFVHDIDLSAVEPDKRLRDSLERLPGRHIVYTNADAYYAEQVLDKLGISDLFDGLFDLTAAELRPKPEPEPYQQLLNEFSIDPTQAVMVEDMVRNLRPARELGMETVWIDTGTVWGRADYHPDIVTFETNGLSEWLHDHSKHLKDAE